MHFAEKVFLQCFTNKQSANSSFVTILHCQSFSTKKIFVVKLYLPLQIHFRFIEILASNCNNACFEQHSLRFVWCSALCFWHVKFYHIWHNSIFCICFIMQKTRRIRRRKSLSRSDVIRGRTERTENVLIQERKISFSSVAAAVFSTLEKIISKRGLSLFSHEFTSQHQHPPLPFT